ncbi:MAG: autotransporter-associated beta strand repeat-containing protein [Opitutaceae bacterium]|jgi:fibronectin-binding autotransporter adhesin|nr:autotransporter-associated beta strand repeat-containing protein [Opitutaceae bacterium]
MKSTMNMYPKNRTSTGKRPATLPLLAASVALSLLVSAPAALAATTQYWWNSAGQVDTNFLTPGNWLIDNTTPTDTPPPGSAETGIQMKGGVNQTLTLDSDFAVQYITFRNWAGLGSFTIAGTGTLSINGISTTGTEGGISNQTTASQTVTNNIQLATISTFLASSGQLTVGQTGSTIDLNQKGLLLRANSTNKLIINGAIIGNPGGPSGFRIQSASDDAASIGTVELNGANTFKYARVNIESGIALAGNDAAFGDTSNSVRIGNNTTNTAAILINGARTIAQNIELHSTATDRAGKNIIGGSTADTSTFTGNITVNTTDASGAAMPLTLTAAEGGRVNLNGNIIRSATAIATGSGDTITKTGAGIVAINGSANDYSGITTVSEGTLLVNGTLAADGDALAVTVNSGATLGGSGTINRAIHVLTGATFSAGDIDATGTSLAGAFTAGAGLTFANGATLAFDLGTTSDTVAVTGGNLTLAGTLHITARGGFAAGSYTLFSVTGGSITDNGLTLATTTLDGYNLSLDFSTTTGKVLLNVAANIPEPATIPLLLGAAATLAAALHFRRAR